MTFPDLKCNINHIVNNIEMKTLTTMVLILVFSACNANDRHKIKHITNMDIQKENIIALVKANNIQAVIKALDNGADINSQDENNRSLLLIATINKQIDMIRLLVGRGADVNMQDTILDSPFLYAGATGQTEVLKLFLANGAKFDIYNRYNGSALIPACERGHVETVKLLANTKDYPIDHINRLGWTALMEAIVLGDGSLKFQQIVQILKDAGADMSIPDHNGVSPLQHAKNRGFDEIAQIISH